MHVSNYTWVKPGLCELAVENKRSHTERKFKKKKEGGNQTDERNMVGKGEED